MFDWSAWRVKLGPWVPLALRLTLGFVFLWSGLSKFGLDDNAIGVCTNRTEAINLVSFYAWLPFDPELFVTVQSVGEIILGLALMVGWGVEVAAALASLLLLSFFAWLDFSLVWKNMALLGASLSLLGLPPDSWRLDRKFHREPPAIPPAPASI
ncbi:MAG: DoxX family membrane protein [Candidatus Kerfeldbacteria bacterium]|nr:DoxX family membrane protein [Candidatus Kerfeldbacteria bacterium]